MKRILRVLVIILVLLAVGLVGLVLFLPVDRIASRLEQEMETATGAEVEIGGARLSVLPRLGVSLGDVTFQGHGRDLARATGAENEIGSYSGAIDKLVVSVPLGPLLRRQAEIESAYLEDLDLEAELKGRPLRVTDGQLEITRLELDLENLPAPAATDAEVGERIPESLVLEFNGRVAEYSQKDIRLDEVFFRGALDTRILTLEEMTAAMGPGRLEGTLEIDYERDPAGILDFEAQAAGVPASRLLLPWLPDIAQRLDSNLQGQVRGNVKLGDPETVQRTFSLTGSLESGDGTLHARDWLKEALPYLGSRQDLVDIRFRSLTHHLRLEQGRYIIDDLSIDGLDTRWTGEGSVGLDGTLDLDLEVLLPEGFTPDLGQWSFLADALRDENGRVKLELNLTGPSARPRVGLDLGTLKDAADSQAGDAVKKGLGGLLDKWKSR